MNQSLALATYRWRGHDSHGGKQQGLAEAIHPDVLRLTLTQQGIKVQSIRKIKQNPHQHSTTKIKSNDLTMFTRQLATLIASGIPVTDALSALKSHQQHAFGNIIDDIKQHIMQGITLAQAFAKYPKIFHKLFISLIHAGEYAGTLDTMLLRLADYSEHTQRLRSHIHKALFYPITVIVIALLISAGLLIFIVPTFETLFANLGATLPVPTQIVITLSQALLRVGWLFAIIIVLSIFAFKYVYRRYDAFAYKIDVCMIQIPILGAILQKAMLARISDTLAITFEAGVPMPEALQIIANTSKNRVFIEAIHDIHQQLLNGQSIARAMQTHTLFPSLVVQMVAIGEESGTLTCMLTKLAAHYHQQVDIAVSHLNTLIEPLLMIILGVVIGSLIIAMYLPIFRIGGIIGST